MADEPEDMAEGTATHNHYPPPPDFDPEEYRADLNAPDLSQEQQDELLRALWQIMCTMVDIGWGVDSVQILLPELFEAASADSVNKDINETKERNGDHE